MSKLQRLSDFYSLKYWSKYDVTNILEDRISKFIVKIAGLSII